MYKGIVGKGIIYKGIIDLKKVLLIE